MPQDRPPSEVPGNSGPTLLGRIHEELRRFEGELASRDVRIAQLQRELQQAQTALRVESQERAVLKAEIESHLGEQVREANHRAEQLAAALRERDGMVAEYARRERELMAQLEQAGTERERVASRLAQTELELRRYGERPETLVAAARASDGRGRAAVVACALVVALGAAVAGLLRGEPQWRVAGLLSAEPPDPAALARSAELVGVRAAAEGLGDMELRMRSADGILELATRSRDPQTGAAELRKLAESIAAESSRGPASRPAARSDEIRTLESKLRDLDARLASLEGATSQPALPPSEKEWAALREERLRLASGLDQAARVLAETRPAAPVGEPDAEQVRQAINADPRLQADAQMLGVRETALRAIMRGVLEEGDKALSSLMTAIPVAVRRLDARIPADIDGEAVKQVGDIRAGIAKWGLAAESLAETWRKQRDRLEKSPEESLRVLSELEPLVRAFVDELAAQAARIRQTLEAIGQGGDQPTKRIVLRNGLLRDLEEVDKAREAASTVVAGMLIARNMDLSAAVKRVAGLRAQVDQQRARIAAALRQRLAEQAADAFRGRIAAARDERERLIARVQELDARILERGGAAMAALQSGGGAIGPRLALNQEYVETVWQLGALRTAEAEEAARMPPPVRVRYAAVSATEVPIPMGQRLGRAAVWGGTPLALVLFAWGAIVGLRSWRRSRAEMAEYTRMLDSANRHLPRHEATMPPRTASTEPAARQKV